MYLGVGGVRTTGQEWLKRGLLAGTVFVPTNADTALEMLAIVEMNSEKLWSQTPVVPLTPGQWVRRIVCGRDLQRSCCVFSIHIHCNCPAAIQCVKENRLHLFPSATHRP
jgi:hypothetical protein